jgi:hypothetical protein
VITRVAPRAASSLAAFSATLDVVACWPGIDAHAHGEQDAWTVAQWAEHLDEPAWDHPFARSPRGGHRPVIHLQARLRPGDPTVRGPEWAEIARRIATETRIQVAGRQGCRWVAVRAAPGRLDLIASGIRHDGTWCRLPAGLLRRLSVSDRRTEHDLGLISPAADHRRPRARQPVPATAPAPPSPGRRP